MLAYRKIMTTFYRLGIFTALSTLLTAVLASAALAVTPGMYDPTAASFNPTNAPGSSHLTSGTPECTVNNDLSIDCNG